MAQSRSVGPARPLLKRLRMSESGLSFRV